MTGKILVLGVGNQHRGDDGAGIAVASKLKALDLPNTIVQPSFGEGTELMEAWKGYGIVFLVDAVRSGVEPGAIHYFEANKQTIPSRFFSYSTHDFSVAEAIEMARALGELPKEVFVFGIEGRQFEHGNELCSEVKDSVNKVASMIQGRIMKIAKLMKGV